jgi:hypothetical protein
VWVWLSAEAKKINTAAQLTWSGGPDIIRASKRLKGEGSHL